MQHTIKERRVDIKHPRKSPSYMPCKLFVGCLPMKPEATTQELQEYFGNFGEISDIYIPKPYRGFGFVTYQEGSDVQKVLAQTHRLRHSTLNITHADPKGAPRRAGPAAASHGDATGSYGYGYGSQFYNPQPQQQPQGMYYSYGTPQQPTQFGYTARGYTPQQQQSGYNSGTGPRPGMAPVNQHQSHMDQYPPQPPNDVPPPAKRPHSGGHQHIAEVGAETQGPYGGAHYGGGGGEAMGYGGN
ncbi:TAR DNA-binding protein 43, partial [Geodia barretti]